MADGGVGVGSKRATPRVILTNYRYEKEAADLSTTELLDWDTRFGRRSPLSRKIITFNLVALGVLLAGVLYLNQFQGGLITLRERAMVSEARLVATAVSQSVTESGLLGENRVIARQIIENLQGSVVTRLALYDEYGFLVSSDVNPDASAQPAEGAPVESKPPSAFTAIMADMWDRLSRIFVHRRVEEVVPMAIPYNDPLAAEAMNTNAVTRGQAATPDGDIILSVAIPVSVGEYIIGAVTVTTRPGDIDAIIRGEREQILQVFALAIISSIMLSLVLANTIVRPLRDLAEAAQEGGTRHARQVNPERILIPDMTGRPDEIGYLSGAMKLMTEALYDRIEQNEMFAADVAHEIKNPLTSLRSAVDTMPYAKTDEDRERLLSVIRKDVNRLDRLVTDISNASRLDSELVRDHMEPFDMHELLRNLIEFNMEQASKVGARLRADFDSTPLHITGMEGRLAQVFVNLITNAISFASEGNEIRIRTEDGARRRTIRVYVEDEGPGIPDDNLKDVFERFYSERPEREEYGNHSGLGLAISKQIVTAHGGTIWAENIRPPGAGRDTPPRGARFVVELPV